jgi:hypothetical protein
VINDNLEVDARVFISNNQKGEETKIAERQRERVCVRDGALLKAKDSVGHKAAGQLEETFGDGHMRLISELLRCC